MKENDVRIRIFKNQAFQMWSDLLSKNFGLILNFGLIGIIKFSFSLYTYEEYKCNNRFSNHLVIRFTQK
jgi:hypothetical protein